MQMILIYMYMHLHFAIIKKDIYAPGLKGPPGETSNRIVCPSVCLFVRLSVILSRLQTKSNN